MASPSESAFINTPPSQSAEHETRNFSTFKEQALTEHLVPNRVYELADDPDNVVVTVTRNGPRSIRLMAVEKNSPRSLTDPQGWHAWQERKAAARAQQDSNELVFVHPTPTAEEKIDRLHAKHEAGILGGKLALTDRVLFECSLSISDQPQLQDVVYVGNYDGEINSGIATAFYLHSLPDAVRRIGKRFITGMNNSDNLDFYLTKLGRVRLLDIRPEFRDRFFANVPSDYSSLSTHTVQFVYPEDRATYCLPTVRDLESLPQTA